MHRRKLLHLAGASLLGIPGLSLLAFRGNAADTAAAFAAADFQQTLNALFQNPPQPSTQISIQAEAVIEDGAFVPLSIHAQLPEVQAIDILVEKNPQPLIARFELDPTTLPFIETRIRMAEPSRVWAVAETRRGNYAAQRFIEVFRGGCGDAGSG